ncbi:MAG TPA: penicillin-binding protein 2 [Egibacteraceae bacterium]|nr:penicillin-binding protein 2 [Egibacteraceae bacterium]
MRTNSRPASLDEAESTRLRLTFLAFLVVSLFVLLFARLWFLQVMAGERYADMAEGNAVRTIATEAPRGKVLDRNGEVLVRNRYAMVVSVQPEEMGERADEIIAELAELLGMSAQEIEDRVESSRVSALRPKPIAIDVAPEIAFFIHENGGHRFPGVYAETLPRREYPHGHLASHIVGYLGEISAEELTSERYAGYRAGDLIGWAGVERSYEQQLRGEEGLRQLEVNAENQVVRTIRETLPKPGADLQLTLDVHAQQIAEDALARGIEVARRTRDGGRGPLRGGTFRAPAGAVVVLDPANGEVLALASNPAFDPGRFVGGVDTEYWDYLQNPDHHFPLINRALQSSYPPGSVYKIVSAAAALEGGFMNTVEEMECPGSWMWGQQRFNNWKRSHSGQLTMERALAESCDTVFYELARRMWEQEQATGAQHEVLPEMSAAFGLGALTGIDLPVEGPGAVPGRAWRQAYWEDNRDVYCTKARQLEPDSYAQAVNADLCEHGARWRGGDAVNLSIGQGDLQTTPLQVANAFAAVANRGTLYRPHVGKEIVHRDGTVETVEPEVLGTLPVSRAHLDYIEGGLLGVTAPGGTASSVFGSFPLQIAGKTGTAELKPKQPFAWFAGYNPHPVDGEQYVVVAMLEEGGGGSQTAAPIVRRVFEGLLPSVGESPVQLGEETD